MKKSLIVTAILFQVLIGHCQEAQLKTAFDYYSYSLDQDKLDSIVYYLNISTKKALIEEDHDTYLLSLWWKADRYEKFQNADSSIYYYGLLLPTTKKYTISDNVLAEIYFQYSNHVGHQDLFIPGLAYLDTAKYWAEKAGKTKLIGEIFNWKAALFDNMGKRKKSLEYYLSAYDLFTQLEEPELVSNTLSNIANIYKKMGDWENAMTYYNLAIKNQEEANNMSGYFVTKVNRGLLYKDMKKFPEAFEDMRAALNFFDATQYTYGIAMTMHNMSEIHFASGDLDSAFIYVHASQKISEEFNYSGAVVSNDLVLAKILNQQGLYRDSNISALRAYNKCTEQGLNEQLVKASKMLASNYEELGNNDLALTYFKEFKTISDSLIDKESREQMLKLRTEYDLIQQEEAIESLEKESRLQEKLSEQKENQNIILIIGISLTIAMIILLSVLYAKQKVLIKKYKYQKGKLSELNEEKDDLMAMVAHDLRSPLNNIWGLLGIIKKEEDQATTDQMIEMALLSTVQMRGRINRILDVKAINTGKIKLVIIETPVESVLQNLMNNIKLEASNKNINVNLDLASNLKCMADENYLLQILENYTNNAIKYSNSGSKVLIKTEEKDNQVIFSIQDEGQGIPENEIQNLFKKNSTISTLPTNKETSNGLGLVIVKKFADAMFGKVWAESKVSQGSIFYLSLPTLTAS
ncbi:MAG: tetratricopeptide repeat-containing sensor histidine kinase [Reichenbachiella sp.]